LAPEHPFPAALHDIVLSFLHLIDKENGYGYDPSSILIMGDSAGGGLALSMMLYLRDHGLPLPGAASLLSVSTMAKASWLTKDHLINDVYLI
jgi:acetyl esterase/lipase